MYPNLYYAFKDLFGHAPKFLQFVNSFGFFVALAFIGAAVIISKELMRKEKEGSLQGTDEVIIVGKPASMAELALNFLLGFVLGFKILGLFFSDSPLATNPQDYIFSKEGSWLAGLLLGFLFLGLKWWEKNKQKLPEPQEKKVRIWPHDRVGDLTIYAAIFGFLGAKIFNSFETWSDFVRDPMGSLLSFSGLTFYGGLICAALAIWYYAKKHKIGFWQLNDSAAPALMFAYAVGRIGCQVSGDGDWGIPNIAYTTGADGKLIEATREQTASGVMETSNASLLHGGTLGNLPHGYLRAPSFLPDWLFAYSYPHNVINEGVKIPACDGLYCSHLPVPVFPTPIYETLVCLGLFFLLWALRKRFAIPGTLFAFYLIINGIERFFIEKIRVNSKYDIFGWHPTQAEIISALLVISGATLWIILKRKHNNPSFSSPQNHIA
jgi:phosphatidylglycerol:prolipoprotein diacylglycerol transferase